MCAVAQSSVSPHSALRGGSVVADAGDEVGVVADGHVERLRHLSEERGEEVDVLRKYRRVLHPQEPPGNIGIIIMKRLGAWAER